MTGIHPKPRFLSFFWYMSTVACLSLCFLYSTMATASKSCRKCSSNSQCPKGNRCVAGCCKLHLVLKDVQLSDFRVALPNTLALSSDSKSKRMARRVRRTIAKLFNVLVGAIRILPKKGYLERSPHNGIELGTFWFTPWTRISSNGLIKTAASVGKNGKVTLRLRYYDVDLKRLSIRENHTIPVSKLKSTLMEFCSKVYATIGGSGVPKGFFSTKIAYVRRGPRGGKDIWIMDVDGTNHRLIVRNGALNLLPRWTPDGRSLLYTSYVDGNAYLYRVDIRTRKTRRLTFLRGTYTGAVCSPNGRRMAFSLTVDKQGSNAEIYMSNINGSGMRRVTRSWGIDASPSWSPDGKQLAFVSERFAAPQIFLMNANGSKQTRLTFKGDYNQEPKWSPTGKEIMFTARDERLQYDLFVIRLDKDASGELKLSYRRLTQNQGKNFEASWSPDGKHIVFVSTRFGEKKIFVMNSDGSKQRLLFRGRGDYDTPAWSPIPGKRLSWGRKNKAPVKKAPVPARKKPAKAAKPAKAVKPAPAKAVKPAPVRKVTKKTPVRPPVNRPKPRSAGKPPRSK